jgi:hypothetical protein
MMSIGTFRKISGAYFSPEYDLAVLSESYLEN